MAVQNYRYATMLIILSEQIKNCYCLRVYINGVIDYRLTWVDSNHQSTRNSYLVALSNFSLQATEQDVRFIHTHTPVELLNKRVVVNCRVIMSFSNTSLHIHPIQNGYDNIISSYTCKTELQLSSFICTSNDNKE